jgi:ribosome-binding ATPase YchF (GTP1/OBG family)
MALWGPTVALTLRHWGNSSLTAHCRKPTNTATLRQEGKKYVVEDGDVVNILFNV